MTASPSLTALLDQVAAAARQVQADLRAHAVRSGWPLRDIAADPWVRRVVADVAAAAVAGRLRGRCCIWPSCSRLKPRPPLSSDRHSKVIERNNYRRFAGASTASS